MIHIFRIHTIEEPCTVSKVDKEPMTRFEDTIHDTDFGLKIIIEDTKSDASTAKKWVQSGTLPREAKRGSDCLKYWKVPQNTAKLQTEKVNFLNAMKINVSNTSRF